MNLLDDEEFMRFQGMEEQARLVKISDLRDEMRKRLHSTNEERTGDCLPWPKTFDTVRLRPGEVSLWAGINGHGKSLVLGQILLWLPYVPIVIASLEMPAAATAARMCQQTVISGVPSEKYIDEFADMTDNFWIYTEQTTVKTQRMLALVMYAGEKLGVKHMMIDSLVKCGIRNDDFDMQKQFVDALCQMAKAYDMHIHLVHHMRKGEKETARPDKFDVRGAGEITDLVDNVFLVHRNKSKERKVENNQHVEELDPDAVILCEKQRHGEWEGKINLYFDRTSHQFMGGPTSRLRWRT